LQTVPPERESGVKVNNKYLRRRTALAIRDLGDELLVLDIKRNRIHQLNRTASFIWHNCEGPSSVEDIAAAMVQAFDVANDTAMADVERVLGQLQELDLVMGADASAGYL
jgi:hypothetical protein